MASSSNPSVIALPQICRLVQLHGFMLGSQVECEGDKGAVRRRSHLIKLWRAQEAQAVPGGPLRTERNAKGRGRLLSSHHQSLRELCPSTSVASSICLKSSGCPWSSVQNRVQQDHICSPAHARVHLGWGEWSSQEGRRSHKQLGAKCL